MHRFGDDLAGFSIGHDPAAGTVLVTCWGFWNVELAASFGATVAEACRQQRGSSLTLDMSDLKPMREEGQRSFGSLMRSLPSLGVTRTSVVTTSHLTKLQLMRLATENGATTGVEWVMGVNNLGRNA
jgi:hypothetical protein